MSIIVLKCDNDYLSVDLTSSPPLIKDVPAEYMMKMKHDHGK